VRHEVPVSETGGESFVPELAEKVRVWPRAGLTPGVSLEGPLLITESAATAWIKPGWVVVVDEWGNLLLQVS